MRAAWARQRTASGSHGPASPRTDHQDRSSLSPTSVAIRAFLAEDISVIVTDRAKMMNLSWCAFSCLAVWSERQSTPPLPSRHRALTMAAKPGLMMMRAPARKSCSPNRLDLNSPGTAPRHGGPNGAEVENGVHICKGMALIKKEPQADTGRMKHPRPASAPHTGERFSSRSVRQATGKADKSRPYSEAPPSGSAADRQDRDEPQASRWQTALLTIIHPRA